MSRRVRLLLVIALMTAGIAVMAYPAWSSFINTIHSSRAVQEFSDRLERTDRDKLLEQHQLAQRYNQALTAGSADPDILEQYDQILDFGNGVMGYIRIPKIDLELSIYHGVSDAVLQKGVGHLPSSALPIGGSGNHCVLTGHTGLPSAALFTGLTELTVGDPFALHVLGETLVYEVDQITVVLPHEVDSLAPVRGQDCCTLVTCTPYGINSHRLLVRGTRIRTAAAANTFPTATRNEKIAVLPDQLILSGTAILLLLSAGTVTLLKKRRNTRGSGGSDGRHLQSASRHQ